MTLGRILKRFENPLIGSRLFFIGDDAIWFNGNIIVRNDRNLLAGLKTEEMDKNQSYYLRPTRDGVRIVGYAQQDDKFVAVANEVFYSKTPLMQLDVITKEGDQYLVQDAFRIRCEPFDYLRGIGGSVLMDRRGRYLAFCKEEYVVGSLGGLLLERLVRRDAL